MFDRVVGDDLGKLKTANVASGGYFALQRENSPHWYIYTHTHYNLTYISVYNFMFQQREENLDKA